METTRGLAGRVLVVGDSAVVCSAVAAGLAAVGWQAGWARRSVATAPFAVVVVTNRSGQVPVMPLMVGGSRQCVVLGRGRSFAALGAVARSLVAEVVNAEQPFDAVMADLDASLSASKHSERGRMLRALAEHEVEALRLATLTAREQQVLCHLIRGRTARVIATIERVEMSTARTHIRAILNKLQVSSQLAAVAMAARSGREPVIVDTLRALHQF